MSTIIYDGPNEIGGKYIKVFQCFWGPVYYLNPTQYEIKLARRIFKNDGNRFIILVWKNYVPAQFFVWREIVIKYNADFFH